MRKVRHTTTVAIRWGCISLALTDAIWWTYSVHSEQREALEVGDPTQLSPLPEHRLLMFRLKGNISL